MTGHRATVTVAGLTWEIHSRNERSATINGHHFFASRCNPSKPWTLQELDRCHNDGLAREIARHGQTQTAGLSALALSIAPRRFFEVVTAAYKSTGGREVLNVMSPGGIVEATFYGEQFRHVAEQVANDLNAYGVAA